MKINKFILWGTIITLSFAFTSGELKFNEGTFPKPIGYVNDFEDILSDEEEAELTKIVEKFERESLNEISIVTIESIEPYDDFGQYTFDLANNWGIGEAEENNGVLVAISKKMGKIRIQKGLGVADKLTDEETNTLINSTIIPSILKDGYYQGLLVGVQKIMDEIR